LSQVYRHLEKHHEKGNVQQLYNSKVAEEKWTRYKQDLAFFGF
jgi:hypothetical protein